MPAATSHTVPINGFACRALRKATNPPLLPAEVAKSIKRDRSYVVKIETGAVSRVSVETFNALVLALGLEDRRAILAFPHADEGEAVA